MRYQIYDKKQIKENIEALKVFYSLEYDEEYISAIENTDYISVAIDQNEIVGASRILTDKLRFALIVDSIVLRDRRRKGIGKKVMSSTLEFLKSMGIFRISLNTDSRYEWLASFYAGVGFVKSEGTYMVYDWDKNE